MPILLLLVVFSLIAIGGVALLLHRLGYTRQVQFVDEEAVREVFQAEFPDLVIDEISLSEDKYSALLTLANTPSLGLVRSMGRFPLVKTILPSDIGRSILNGRDLNLKFHDYADPDFCLTFPEGVDLRDWQSLFGHELEESTHA